MTYASRVPSGDAVAASNVGVVGDGTLGLVSVLGDEAVDAIRAGNFSQGPRGIVVAGVVGDFMLMLVLVMMEEWK